MKLVIHLFLFISFINCEWLINSIRWLWLDIELTKTFNIEWHIVYNKNWEKLLYLLLHIVRCNLIENKLCQWGWNVFIHKTWNPQKNFDYQTLETEYFNIFSNYWSLLKYESLSSVNCFCICYRSQNNNGELEMYLELLNSTINFHQSIHFLIIWFVD